MVYKLIFQEAKEVLFSGKLRSILVLSLIFNILVSGNQKVGHVTCGVRENKGELLLPLLPSLFFSKTPANGSFHRHGRKEGRQRKRNEYKPRANQLFCERNSLTSVFLLL